jgi:hypothetical protein
MGREDCLNTLSFCSLDQVFNQPQRRDGMQPVLDFLDEDIRGKSIIVSRLAELPDVIEDQLRHRALA